MAETKQTQGSTFISYSRKDKVFVRKLNDALDQAGIQAWVDWEGIELAADWMKTIEDAIRSHDAFIFIISPDSLKSEICAKELELGINFNKKLIPVLFREPEKSQKMHEKLAATNWVYLRKQDDFIATVPKLVDSVRTDLAWVSKHTQLLGQALEWESRGRNKSYLLQGTGLEEAERWMAEASLAPNRQVLPLQAEFIVTSRRAAHRRQRRILVGVSLALVVSIVLSIVALFSRRAAIEAQRAAEQSQAQAEAAQAQAEAAEAQAVEAQKRAEASEARAVENEAEAVEQSIRAYASRGTAEAQNLQSRSGELDTSTLVAIESYQLQVANNLPETDSAEDIIRANSSRMAKPVALLKQDGAIWNIEWSPDFQFFVTGNGHDPADEDAITQACVYRADDGQAQYCVVHDNDVNDAIFTKDGKYLVTASADQTVRFWDAATGDSVNELTLTFEGAALDLDASNDVVAIGREDNFLTLYYLNKPDLDPVNVEQVEGVGNVKFSPSGELLALGLQNGQVRFWQARNLFSYNGPRHDPSSYAVLEWSPDNLWLASGGGDSLAKITKRDGSFQYNVTHQDWVEDVAFGPDPTWFTTASDDNIIRVLNTDDGTEKFRMAHTDFAQKVAVSRDGQWIASTGYDQVVRIWDSISGTQLLEIPLDANGSAISFNEDASRLVVADESGVVGIWDISRLKARASYIEFPEFVRDARFTPSGEFLIVNSDDYNVWRIPADQIDQFTDGTAGTVILTTESLTYDTAVSPDSQWVAAVEYNSEDAQKNRGVLTNINGTIQYPLEHGGQVTAVAFTGDSGQVVTAGIDGLIKFWDVITGAKQDRELDNSEPVLSLAVSPAASLLAAGLDNKTRIWDSTTGQTLQNLPQAGEIVTATFNQDGTLLATGSSEGIVRIWKADGDSFAQAGETIFIQHGNVNSLAFSPDGAWLSGGSSNGTAYLWDVASSHEAGRIPLGSAPVTSVSFSIDGEQLLTVSRKVIRVWDLGLIDKVPEDNLIDYACSHLTSNLSFDDWVKYFGETEYKQTCPGLTEK